ncbi:peptidoglycan-binding domain-containing protein [Microvirga roseola]|uniref:peptidoglycan-binding domain-containing protein n=1 Tax=Microvirga roseola TaxID=2883126 RepID=UPI001E5A1193|nr:peptidoglycan-binding domain-containing protein [Microvirga roseola]
MSRTRTPTISEPNRLPLLILAVATIGGWGLFAYAMLTASDAEAQLRGKIASLEEYRVQYLSERRKTEETEAELTKLRSELASAKQDLGRVTEDNGRLLEELAGTQAELGEARRIQVVQAGLERMPLINVTPRPTKVDVKAAQEALTELGYGPLKADGVLGKQTREAIEKYQRATGLTATGELYAETLQTLLRAGEAVASQ